MLSHIWRIAALLCIIGTGVRLLGQTPPCPSAEQYKERGGHCDLAPKLITVTRVRGRAVRSNGDGSEWPPAEMSGACLSLFTEDSHNFVSSRVVDSEGRFDFGAVPPGRYRLIARAGGFPIGNNPVKVVRFGWFTNHRIIISFEASRHACTSAFIEKRR